MGERQYQKAQKRLGVAMRRHRARLGLTQEEAAHRMGVVPRYIQKLEAGEVNATIQTLGRIAAVFHVDIGDLFE